MYRPGKITDVCYPTWLMFVFFFFFQLHNYTVKQEEAKPAMPAAWKAEAEGDKFKERLGYTVSQSQPSHLKTKPIQNRAKAIAPHQSICLVCTSLRARPNGDREFTRGESFS